MKDHRSIRLIVVGCALLIGLGFQINLIWRDVFDSVGIILAGLLVGPVLLLFIDIEGWFTHHPGK
jgi:hypothetical protein